VEIPAQVRPLRAHELVDAGFALARRVLPRTVVPMLLVITPLAVALWLTQSAFLNVETDPFTGAVDESLDALFGVVILLVQLLALGAAALVCMPACLESYTETPAQRWSANLALLARRAPAAILVGIVAVLFVGPLGMAGAVLGTYVGGIVTVFAVALLGGVGVVIGFVLIFGTFAMLSTFFVAALPTLFVERCSGTAAVARSFRLGGSRFLAFTGALLVLFAVAIVAWLALQGAVLTLLATQSIESAAIQSALSVLVGVLATMLIGPAVAGVCTAMYFDARVRKEGLDLLWALQEPA